MARYSRRISENIERRNKEQAKENRRDVAPTQRGTLLILILLVVNFVLLIATWSGLTYFDRGVYIALEIAFLSIYLQRRLYRQVQWAMFMEYTGYIFMGLAAALFIYKLVVTYIF